MSDNNNNAPTANGGSLAENEYVQELFLILESNGRDTNGLSAIIGHVSQMEDFVKRAEDKIGEMKTQLSEMKEAQSHPVRTALQKTIKSLESAVAAMKEQIRDLKNSVVEGCKNAVTAFKEKGISALDKLASFFRIKSAVKAIDKSAQQEAAYCDSTVKRINEYANQYHTAGRAVKNLGRMFVGLDPIDAKKEAGMLAKAFAAPYKAQKALMVKISGLAVTMTKNLEQLETTAAKRENPVRAKQPKLLEELSDAKKVVEQRKREMPIPERTKTREAVV